MHSILFLVEIICLAKVGYLNEKIRYHNDTKTNKYSTLAESTIVKDSVQLQAEYFYSNGLSNIAGVRYDSAQNYLQHASWLFKIKNDSLNYANTLLKLGNVYESRSEMNDAQVYYAEAYSIYQKLGELEKAAKALIYLANTYFLQDNYNKALHYYLLVMQKYETSIQTNDVSVCLQNIGLIHYYLTDYKQSNEFCKKAILALSKRDDQLSEAYVFDMIGTNYLHLNQFDSAFVYYKYANTIATEFNDQRLLADNENNLGEYYLQAEKNQEAYRYFVSSNKRFEKDKDLYGIALTLIGVGIASERLGNLNSAVHKMLQAKTISKKINSIFLQSETAKALSIVYEKLGDYPNSLANYKQFKLMADSLVNLENIKKVTSLQLKYEFDLKQRKVQFEQQQRELNHTLEIRKMKLRRTILIIISIFIILLLSLAFMLYLAYQRKKIDHLKIEINKNLQHMLGQQMNPHFIFNTLKSIQNYILSNDVKNSNIFLTRFASLIRMILENSQQEFIFLKNELQALELYMQLEQLRTNQKFEYKVVLDNAVNTSELKVPSLFLQPYVENAIWHGIAPLTVQGLITIRIWIENNRLHFTIEDNGVGFKEKSKQVAPHRSLGLSITEKRIQLLNKLYNTELVPQLGEIKNPDNSICGTSVQLSLPQIIQ